MESVVTGKDIELPCQDGNRADRASLSGVDSNEAVL